MFLFDVLLLSVIVVTAYLGPMVLRRLGPGQRMYGWMVLGDLALAIVALASRKSDGPNPTADLVGTIAIGGAVCLVMVPPALRTLARRALVADRLRLARLLVDVREHLQPGMGARQESELISTIIEVRGGQVDAAVERLRQRRDQMPDPLTRRPLDERIVMTYLYARRWDDAVAWFERHVSSPPLPPSPQLSVEMVRAYCERGDLEKAGGLIEGLEGSAGQASPLWTLLLSRARLVFLAFAGRTAAVEAILGPRGPLGAMPESGRCYWSGVARLKAGDRTGARTSLERAAKLSGRDDRARELAEVALQRIDEPGAAGPPEAGPAVDQLADRLSQLAAAPGAHEPSDAESARDESSGRDPGAGMVPAGGVGAGEAAAAAPRRARQPARQGRAPRLSGVSWREVPVTTALVVANVLALIGVYLASGSTSDLGALVRAGANVKWATAGGEWWRLCTSMFLHVGVLHLALNMYGLWVLGRLVEQFVGRTRMFVIYMGAGLVGAAASLVVGGAATSAGASGAVFGLVGAAAAELALNRRAYPRRWSGALLGNLVFLTLANLVVGFMYPMIDQSAHVGGLIGGAVLGALLSPKPRFARAGWMRGLVAVLAVVSGAWLVYGGWGVATSDFGRTLSSQPRVARTIGGLDVTAPAVWDKVSDTELMDPGVGVILHLQRAESGGDAGFLAREIAAWREQLRTEGGKQFGFERARQVKQAALAVPRGWRIEELETTTEGDIGGDQIGRVAVIGRTAGSEVWMGIVIYPTSLAADVAPTIDAVLSSARPNPGASPDTPDQADTPGADTPGADTTGAPAAGSD